MFCWGFGREIVCVDGESQEITHAELDARGRVFRSRTLTLAELTAFALTEHVLHPGSVPESLVAFVESKTKEGGR